MTRAPALIFLMRSSRFFSSYNAAASGWMYSLGQFAQQTLPLTDSVKLTIQRVNTTKIETVTVRTSLGEILSRNISHTSWP